MYSPDSRDRVVELTEMPQSSIGAPLPIVVATERRLLLAYLIKVTPSGWDGTSVRVVGYGMPDELAALVEFQRPEIHSLGPPNDEAFAGHPLAERGLHPNAAFEVQGSAWVRELERMNAVHPYHRPERYERLRHFIFAFHDSTFECIAEGISVLARATPIGSVLQGVQQRLTAAAS